MKPAAILVGAAIACAAFSAQAADITIKVRAVSAKGIGKEIGTLRAVDTKKGLMIVPRLAGLRPGAHGFHVHANPSCRNKAGRRTGAALAAGGHYDPRRTGRHAGPKGGGHLGDLPVLTVDGKGRARTRVIAPRLRVADLWGRAIVIHAGGDNYSDKPKALGGGGARVACATIVKAAKKPMTR